MATTELRQAYFDILMEQVRACRFPSPTMMDRLEEAVRDRETAEEYVRAILETMSEERFPSPMMLDRVAGLIDVLDAIQALDGARRDA
ncbi:MAG TPA: hypothetical protein VFH58_06790 [Acidimicrobiales bacterium]|nr:hypothetical protein [Acidimicrobiales bacterium]